MTTLTPPAHSKVATAPVWEVATVEDLWRESDRLGVLACTLLGAPDEFVRGKVQNAGNL